MSNNLIARLKTMHDFLSGSEAYEGVWFGDAHPSIRGGFWWRTPLRALVKELIETITCLTTFRDEKGQRRYLHGWQDLTLQYDNFEREARNASDIILKSSGYNGDRITMFAKLVKAAFLSGRNSLLAEMNDKDGQPDALTLRLCQCGHAACTKTYFGNLGSFYQGSGFEPADAAYLKAAYDFAKAANMTIEKFNDPAFRIMWANPRFEEQGA